MRSLLVFLLITALPFFGFTQTYHFPTTVRYFSKTTNFGTVHGYLEIVNDSGDTVPMKWISRRGLSCPAGWNFNFDDQNNYYATVEHLDSGAFDMYPPGTFNQKMIIGLTHNGQTGMGSIFFTIFPEHDRPDSTVIEFHFTITPGTVDTTDTTDTTAAIVHLSQPSTYRVTWVEDLRILPLKQLTRISVFDLRGNLVYTQRNPLAGTEVRLITDAPAVVVEVLHKSRLSRKKFGHIP